MILFEDPMRRFVPLPFSQVWRSAFVEVCVRASDEQLLQECGLLRAAVENGPVLVRSIRAAREPYNRLCARPKVLLALPLALLSWGETQMYLDVEQEELLCFVGERCLSGNAWASAYRELAMAVAMAELQTRDNDSTAS